jgi:hypothetical protein
MKFTFDQEWLQKHADSDQNLEIAAGSFSLDQLPPALGLLAADTQPGAVGQLVDVEDGPEVDGRERSRAHRAS